MNTRTPNRLCLPWRWAGLAFFLLAPAVFAADEAAALRALSLAELGEVEIISVSRREENLQDAASAIYVIRDEDIRRTGVRSIPEALRMVPGMNVAQINANKWAISSRGFNGRFANKLLVLMDGRTVYSPLFSGVYWDVQDTFLEDIDQIEVIRGPGATLWGANAVNGVVNIITKSARDTQGGVLLGGAGNEEIGFGGARYGGRISSNAFYRVYAKTFYRDDLVMSNGRNGSDEWHSSRGGFRTDWYPSEGNHYTFQGDIYAGESGDRFFLATPSGGQWMSEEAEVRGGNLLGRWRHDFNESSQLSWQVYFDRNERDSRTSDLRDNTFDLDLHHSFSWGERQRVIWGAGYRLYQDDINGTYHTQYDPQSRTTHLFSAFLQDEITLVPDKVRWTIGTKLEHNDYSGVEAQPSTRLSWTPTDTQTVWASVARAVRTPSRAVHDLRANLVAPGATNIIVRFTGDESFVSEELIAYEIGYRIQPHSRVSFDTSLFYNQYDHLNTNERGAVTPGPITFVDVFPDNQMEGGTWGVEIASHWQVTDAWSLHAGYSFLKMDLSLESGSTAASAALLEGESPKNQFHVRSYLDLPRDFAFDTALYYVDRLSTQAVPSYFRWDVRLGWKPSSSLEVSLVAQNILDNRHPEFGSSGYLLTPTEVERSFYGQLTWRF